jgi:hypothetical protein
VSGHGFERTNRIPTDEQRHGAENAKAAIDEAPGQRDSPDRTGDESERDDADTGDKAKRDDSFVAHGIDPRPDKGDGNHKMGKGKPIGPVGEKWESCVGRANRIANAFDPLKQVRGLRNRLNRG